MPTARVHRNIRLHRRNLERIQKIEADKEEAEKAAARRKAVRLELGDLKLDDQCPLLLKATIDDLPPLIQQLYDEGPDSIRDAQTTVDFFVESLPPHPCVFFLPSMFFFAIFIAVLVNSDRAGTGGYVVYMIVGVSAGLLFTRGFQTMMFRMPLFYAKNEDGSRKAWPGDYKWGVYLVGNSALFELKNKTPTEFEKPEASLFPVTSIISVQYVSNVEKTILKIRSPPGSENESFEHTLGFEEPDVAFVAIRDWFLRSTTTSSM